MNDDVSTVPPIRLAGDVGVSPTVFVGSVLAEEEEEVPPALIRYVYKEIFPGRERCSVSGSRVAS